MQERNQTMLVVVDAQERMMPAIEDNEAVADQIVRLVKACCVLEIPMLVTEQYSKGLGPTLPQIRTAMQEWYRPIEKMTFSAVGEMYFMGQLEASGRQHILVCGVEAHICVYQTARDLRSYGHEVEVVADAVGSRRNRNRDIALERLTRHGVELTTVEATLFDLMITAENSKFKEISALVK